MGHTLGGSGSVIRSEAIDDIFMVLFGRPPGARFPAFEFKNGF